MGVPTFYKWLCQKWPKVVVECIEEHSEFKESVGSFVPVNCTEPNPSGIEFDNLYLDMNGIVHPCAHPESISEQPETEEEMFLNVFTYIDRLFNCVRPRSCLFMAIDGVAPRAKMNQQRLRRFKAAAGSREKREKYNKLRKEFELEGREVPPFEEKWDHNVITPGTPFMAKLGDAIRFYIQERLTNDPAWKDLKVVFSDSSVPGEGEHKIMQYIRDQRVLPGYDWNQSHCVYGMDADLIMLGLATHEARFYIVREEVSTGSETEMRERYCAICNTKGHWASDCMGEQLDEAEKEMSLNAKGLTSGTKKTNTVVEVVGPNIGVDYETTSKSSRAFKSSWPKLQFLSIAVLREYLGGEFAFDNVTLSNGHFVDFERCIDDLLLMCFFVGNDFLPHLPALSIHKGSIDQMLLLYQKLLPRLGDYLTCNGCINYDILSEFCKYLALAESEILQNEHKKVSVRSSREKQNSSRVESIRKAREQKSLNESSESEGTSNTRQMTEEEHNDYFNLNLKKVMETPDEAPEVKQNRDSRVVQLGGEPIEKYRPRYYRAKLKLPECDADELGNDPEVERAAIQLARAYTIGLSWVLQYYLQGTINWEWYYPFHYAPFTVDIVKFGLIGASNPAACYEMEHDEYEPSQIVEKLKSAENGPFHPYEQLLAVLPIASGHALPLPYQRMMKEINGPLADVYPFQFQEDSDGRKYSWQWIPLLPFIDAKRLVQLGNKAWRQCTEEEQKRNLPGQDFIFSYSPQTDQALVSPIPTLAYTRYAPYPWPKTLPTGACCASEVLVHPDRQLHRSELGTGVIPPKPVLTLADLCDDASIVDAQNKQVNKQTNAFNANVARRIIMTTLCAKGLASKDEVDQFEDPRHRQQQGGGGGHHASRHGNIRHQDYGNTALGAVQSHTQDARNSQYLRPDSMTTSGPDGNIAMMDSFAAQFKRDRQR